MWSSRRDCKGRHFYWEIPPSGVTFVSTILAVSTLTNRGECAFSSEFSRLKIGSEASPFRGKSNKMIHCSNPLLSTEEVAVNCQLSTVNCQLSTVNCQLMKSFSSKTSVLGIRKKLCKRFNLPLPHSVL